MAQTRISLQRELVSQRQPFSMVCSFTADRLLGYYSIRSYLLTGVICRYIRFMGSCISDNKLFIRRRFYRREFIKSLNTRNTQGLINRSRLLTEVNCVGDLSLLPVDIIYPRGPTTDANCTTRYSALCMRYLRYLSYCCLIVEVAVI